MRSAAHLAAWTRPSHGRSGCCTAMRPSRTSWRGFGHVTRSACAAPSRSRSRSATCSPRASPSIRRHAPCSSAASRARSSGSIPTAACPTSPTRRGRKRHASSSACASTAPAGISGPSSTTHAPSPTPASRAPHWSSTTSTPGRASRRTAAPLAPSTIWSSRRMAMRTSPTRPRVPCGSPDEVSCRGCWRPDPSPRPTASPSRPGASRGVHLRVVARCDNARRRYGSMPSTMRWKPSSVGWLSSTVPSPSEPSSVVLGTIVIRVSPPLRRDS